MVCGVAAPGLALRPYFDRYTEDASCAASWGCREAQRHRRGGRREVLSRGARSRSRHILRDRRRDHLPGLAAVRAISRTTDRERSARERSGFEQLHTVPQRHQAPPRLPSSRGAEGVWDSTSRARFNPKVTAKYSSPMSPALERSLNNGCERRRLWSLSIDRDINWQGNLF
jgi:hypothetical protein